MIVITDYEFTSVPRDDGVNEVREEVRTLTCTNRKNGRRVSGTIFQREDTEALSLQWASYVQDDGPDLWAGGIFHALARTNTPVRRAAANGSA